MQLKLQGLGFVGVKFSGFGSRVFEFIRHVVQSFHMSSCIDVSPVGGGILKAIFTFGCCNYTTCCDSNVEVVFLAVPRTSSCLNHGMLDY